MLNVVSFQDRAKRSRRSRLQRPSVDVCTEISELASRVTGLQSKARGELDNAILMLDLAAQHARQIATRVCDPPVKKSFEEHVSIIEQLLQIARDMTRKL